MIEPHGGKLIDQVLDISGEAYWRDRLSSLPAITLNPRQLSDLELIAWGAFSPLEGFITREDYLTILHHMRLANGIPWSLPITLAVSGESSQQLKEGKDIALLSPQGKPAGILHLEEVYPYDKELEARLVFRTTDANHPGVRVLYSQGDWLLGGKIHLFSSNGASLYGRYDLKPAQSHAIFAQKGWRTVVGFQTRNPIHRAHEYIQKCALEIVDGLFLHPLVGETKADDIPVQVRLRCYEVLLEHYYPQDHVVLGVFPAFMRYAGPREAIFHAIVRKNYGCTHLIVGRDHAGVGNYYGSYDAHHIFKEFPPGELGIVPLFFENAFYCRRCQSMATNKTCPHPESDHVNLSGTQVRNMLRQGIAPPLEFTRSEVAQVLLDMSGG